MAELLSLASLLVPALLLLSACGTFYAVKNASWTYSASARSVDRYSIDFKSEVIDTTSMVSSGYQENLDGVYSASASVEGTYNGALGLTQGQSVSHALAIGGGGPTFTVTYRVASIKLDGQVRNGAHRFSLALESNGTYTVTF
jgi:hypothetical protein